MYKSQERERTSRYNKRPNKIKKEEEGRNSNVVTKDKRKCPC